MSQPPGDAGTLWWAELDEPLLGRYRVERSLGQGGMADVWLARDIRFDSRKVAIKPPNLDKFPADQVDELLARFHQEVKRQANDSIFGTVRLLDAGEVVDTRGVRRQILVMDYLAGGSLGTVLGGTPGHRAHTQTLAEVNRWLPQVAATLDRLHSRKILHRDVKPDNLLFDQDGNAFLADLGIATSLDDIAGAGTLATLAGTMGPGSPGYQAPETLRGEKLAASDQFSLAVTVYEALAGALPMPAYSRDGWIMALANWQPKELALHQPTLPAPAAAAVMRALSATWRDRFPSCGEFATALAAAMHAKPASPPPRPQAANPSPTAGPGFARQGSTKGDPMGKAAKPPKKRAPRWLVGFIVATIAVIVIGLGWAALRVSRMREVAHRPEWLLLDTAAQPWSDARDAQVAIHQRLDTEFSTEGGNPSTLQGRLNTELDLIGAAEKCATSLMAYDALNTARQEQLDAFASSGGDQAPLRLARADFEKMKIESARMLADAKVLSQRTAAAVNKVVDMAGTRSSDPEFQAADSSVGALAAEVDAYGKAVDDLSKALVAEEKGLRGLETR